MKKIFLSLIIFLSITHTYSSEIKLVKIFEGLNKPWSLSFIDGNNILVTEKTGNLLVINLKTKQKSTIKHNLSVLEDGQEGLLDILYHNSNVYVSYSENRGNWHSSTSVTKGMYNNKKYSFKKYF